MIVQKQQDLTPAVLAEVARAQDPRLREILSAAVTHLHAFARDARLTEAEFHQACGLIAQLGQASNASHNEVVLAAGSLGLSALVCLLNNGNQGQTETSANLTIGTFHPPFGVGHVQADIALVERPRAHQHGRVDPRHGPRQRRLRRLPFLAIRPQERLPRFHRRRLAKINAVEPRQ